MKIQGGNRPYPVEPTTRRVTTSVGETRRAATGNDSVQMSSEARILLEAKKPEVPDQAKIAELRNAIENGTFEIDATRIADAMIDQEL